MSARAAARHLEEKFAMAFELGDSESLTEALSELETLAAVGLVDQGDATRWRERFARLQRPHPKPPSDLRVRARRHLDELADSDELSHRIALAAYARAGLVDEVEGERAVAEDVSEWDEGDWPEEMRHAFAIWGFSRADPVAMVAGPRERVGGLSVTAIELFADGVRAHWHFTSREGETAAGKLLRDLLDPVRDHEDHGTWGRDQTPFALRDDLGTGYIVRLGGATWDGREDFVAYGECVAVPAVPAAATRLAIVVGERELWVLLRDP
jgi:hypothetical protein